MTDFNDTTEKEAADRRARWDAMARNYRNLWAKEIAERKLRDASEGAGGEYPESPRMAAALEDARDDIAHTYAEDWAGLGLHAQVYVDATEGDYWREKATAGSPTYWLAKIIDGAAAIEGKVDGAHDLAVLELIGATEACAHAFVHHRDGYQDYGCNPTALVWIVDLITTMQESARRLADNPKHNHYFGAAFGAVWFGQGSLYVETAQ